MMDTAGEQGGMGGEGLRPRALAAQQRLREAVHRVAEATDDALAEALVPLRAALDEYDDLLSQDLAENTLGWPEDARERIARARVELKLLESGEAIRKDVVGMVRLVIPRFDEEERG